MKQQLTSRVFIHPASERPTVESYGARLKKLRSEQANKDQDTNQQGKAWIVVRVDDLPPLKKRALICELQRQNKHILETPGTYKTKDIINTNQALRGQVYWADFISDYSLILI